MRVQTQASVAARAAVVSEGRASQLLSRWAFEDALPARWPRACAGSFSPMMPHLGGAGLGVEADNGLLGQVPAGRGDVALQPSNDADLAPELDGWQQGCLLGAYLVYESVSQYSFPGTFPQNYGIFFRKLAAGKPFSGILQVHAARAAASRPGRMRSGGGFSGRSGGAARLRWCGCVPRRAAGGGFRPAVRAGRRRFRRGCAARRGPAARRSSSRQASDGAAGGSVGRGVGQSAGSRGLRRFGMLCRRGGRMSRTAAGQERLRPPELRDAACAGRSLRLRPETVAAAPAACSASFRAASRAAVCGPDRGRKPAGGGVVGPEVAFEHDAAALPARCRRRRSSARNVRASAPAGGGRSRGAM